MYVPGTSGVVTVIRSIGNNHHGHISRVGTWCWAQTGLTGQASIKGFTMTSLLMLFSSGLICYIIICLLAYYLILFVYMLHLDHA